MMFRTIFKVQSSIAFKVGAAPFSLMAYHLVPTICLTSHIEIETRVGIYLTVDDLFQVMGFARVLDLRFYLIL